MTQAKKLLALLGVLAIVGAACSNSSSSSNGAAGGGGITPAKTYTSIGATEGQLNLIAWNGYTEDGSNDPNYDWVTPFEKQTDCKVNVKYADTSDEMVTLMRQGGGSQYDGVSASGDASNRLIAGGDVGAIDPSMFPSLSDVIAPLSPTNGTNNSHYVVDGNVYGVPYMYGPNFLMYNTKVVKPAPTSWDVTFEPTINGQPNPYAGHVTAYGGAIYMADAAMYLKTKDPSLGITDPYELTSTQLDAVVNLLKAQKPLITKYWSAYTDEIDGFVDNSMVVGTAWPVNLTYAKADAPVAAVIPKEGVTGWADTWMISANAPHPNCMLKWMDYTLQPDVQAQVGLWYGAAGSNTKSCDLIAKGYGKGGAAIVNTVEYSFCGNADFLNSIYLWKTPTADCGDSRGETCEDYSVWQQKWTEITGA
ncbi:MAG: putative spermidine/putrescine transport system substrate-binding protein [Actinomycetota bacterium]|nr:putative spermidine/putrescine transport system substrate-binding protein [Actinomycetota bacterium]